MHIQDDNNEELNCPLHLTFFVFVYVYVIISE